MVRSLKTEMLLRLDRSVRSLCAASVIPRPQHLENVQVSQSYCRCSTQDNCPSLCLLMMLLAILSVACQGGGESSSTRIVSDSAGIELVMIRPPEDTPAPGPTVEPEPRLSIGVESGSSSQELSDVSGAIRLPDGRIVVGNGGSKELRFYGADGKYLYSTGDDGEGPGEFRSLDFLGLIESDSIVVHDRRLERLTLFDTTGAFLSSRGPTVSTGMPFLNVAGVLRSGAYVSWALFSTDPEIAGVYAASVRFGVTPLSSGVFHEAGTVLGGEEGLFQYHGSLTRAFRPFGRESDIAAGANHFFVLTSSDDSGIRVYDPAGKLIRILRIDIPRQRVDAAATAAWIESWIARYSDGSTATDDWLRHGFRETPPPEYIPVLRSLEVDKSGNVCAERYPLTMDAVTVYWCFSPEGHFLRSIVLPRRLLRNGPHPHMDPQLEIGEDYVLGVWQNENDVQYVRLFALLQ